MASRDRYVKLSLTAAELRKLSKAAEKEGRPIANWLRRVALLAAEGKK